MIHHLTAAAFVEHAPSIGDRGLRSSDGGASILGPRLLHLFQVTRQTLWSLESMEVHYPKEVKMAAISTILSHSSSLTKPNLSDVKPLSLINYGNKSLSQFSAFPSHLCIKRFRRHLSPKAASSSEANELALMMAILYMGCHDVIWIRSGYHGNAAETMGAIAQSSYKFNVVQGVGGIMELAPGYLPAVYSIIKKAGGLFA